MEKSSSMSLMSVAVLAQQMIIDATSDTTERVRTAHALSKICLTLKKRDMPGRRQSGKNSVKTMVSIKFPMAIERLLETNAKIALFKLLNTDAELMPART